MATLTDAATLFGGAKAVTKPQSKPPENYIEWLIKFERKVKRIDESFNLKPMAPRHKSVWEWLDKLEIGKKPKAKIDSWPRGGGKSSTVEMGVVYLSEKKTRTFALYVCATQDQANEHVKSIADLMEKVGIERKLGKYGQSKGWSQSQITTSNGFTITAFGIDKSSRGVKSGQARPDLIIIDDIDSERDTLEVVNNKKRAIVQKVLPTGSSDCAVIFIQNKIHAMSVMNQILTGVADFLQDREAPYVDIAVKGLQVERRKDDMGFKDYIVSGNATWEGQNIETCQHQIWEWGLKSFLKEAQQEVEDSSDGALWTRAVIEDNTVDDSAELRAKFKRVVVALDPAVTANSESSDLTGIVVAAIGDDGHYYVLRDYSGRYKPEKWAEAVYKLFGKGVDEIVVETNQGGDFIVAALRNYDSYMPITQVKHKVGKKLRAEPVSMIYPDGLVHHVRIPRANGYKENPLADLEAQMITWDPSAYGKSPDRIDALVMAITALMKYQDVAIKITYRGVPYQRN